MARLQSFAIKEDYVLNSKLHLSRTVIEGTKIDKVKLINLDQCNQFKRDDHQYLAVVLQVARLQP